MSKKLIKNANVVTDSEVFKADVLVSGETIEEIGQNIICEDAEITLEVNPGTVDPTFFAEVKKAGFNRLSVGMQSASNDDGVLFVRNHSALGYSKELLSLPFRVGAYVDVGDGWLDLYLSKSN